MLARVRFLATYLLFWVAFFVVARLLFLVYHGAQTARLGAATVAGALTHGLRMDLSAASYATVLPAVLAALSFLVAPRRVAAVIAAYTMVLLAVASLLVTVDLQLFTAWGFRLDATLLRYLATPREMMASAGSSPVLLLTVMLLALAGGSIWAFRRLMLPLAAAWERGGSVRTNALGAAAMLALTALLVIPIRGGLQLAPLNASAVYFSRAPFANQAALNPVWTFLNAASDRRRETTNRYRFLPPAVADSLVGARFAPASPLTAPNVLRVPRPNVVLIVWESFTAKVVRRLGGLPDVTPRFDSLTREGLLFDHAYATGDRTDKGLIALLSGFPAQPRTDIIKLPNKTARLPILSRDLRRAGYRTAFYYGGELEFANIRSYLVNGGFDELMGKSDFDRREWNSKWGAHDHVLFGRVLRELPRLPRPFFAAVLTLSSHEPFEVPTAELPPGAVRHVAAGRDEQSLFLDAHAYADWSVGEFVRRAQRQPWWDSTLIIIVADHGHRLPALRGAAPNGAPAPEDYHIPMLWLGGALRPRDSVVTRVVAQTDLPATLLSQLALPAADYRWSRDALAPTSWPFAFFVVHDGVGVVTDRGAAVYDYVARRTVLREGAATDADVRAGLACVQEVVDDFLRR